MRKADPNTALPVIDHRDSGTPLWVQLREGLRRQILDGRLQPGDALVPVRRMCKELDINRVTADQAIRELVTEGLLRSERGRGVFVNEVAPFRVALIINRMPEHLADQDTKGYVAMFKAAMRALTRKNVGTVVVGRSGSGGKEKFGPPIEDVLASEADGYLTIGIQHQDYLAELVASERPVVALDAAPLMTSFDGVVLDTFRTGYLAARHLLERGHRRMLFVGYDRGVHPFAEDETARIPEPDSERMAAGFIYALKEAGVSREDARLYDYFPREGELQQAFDADLLSGTYTAAVLVHGHAESLRAAGRLPETISVVVTEAACGAAGADAWTRVEVDESDFGRMGAQRMLLRLSEVRVKGRSPSGGSVSTIEPVLVDGPSTRRVGPPPPLYAHHSPRRHAPAKKEQS